MKKLLILFSVLLSLNVFAQDTVTIPKETFNEIKKRLSDLNSIEKAIPFIEFEESIVIVEDTDGRIYLKSPVIIKMKLDYLNYEISLDLTNAEIFRVPEKEKLFQHKIKLGLMWVDFSDKTFAVSYSPIIYKGFSPNIFGSTHSFGLSLDYHVLRNMSPFIGIGYRYDYFVTPSLMAGINFTLN